MAIILTIVWVCLDQKFHVHLSCNRAVLTIDWIETMLTCTYWRIPSFNKALWVVLGV